MNEEESRVLPNPTVIKQLTRKIVSASFRSMDENALKVTTNSDGWPNDRCGFNQSPHRLGHLHCSAVVCVQGAVLIPILRLTSGHHLLCRWDLCYPDRQQNNFKGQSHRTKISTIPIFRVQFYNLRLALKTISPCLWTNRQQYSYRLPRVSDTLTLVNSWLQVLVKKVLYTIGFCMKYHSTPQEKL